MTRLRTTLQATRLAPVFVAIDDSERLVVLRFLRPARARADAGIALARVRASGFEVVENARACAPFVREVKRYLAGRTRKLDVVAATQGTAFQRSVWRAVARIPYGRTITYRELATRVRRPNAWRAVAGANAANPVALVVPSHRVVGSDGSATGYDGGVAVKEALLALEAKARA